MPRNGQFEVVAGREVVALRSGLVLPVESVISPTGEVRDPRIDPDPEWARVLDVIQQEYLHVSESISSAFRYNMQFVKGKLAGRVLDIGAGNGAMTHLLADAYPDATFYGVEPLEDRSIFETLFQQDHEFGSKMMRAVRQIVDEVYRGHDSIFLPEGATKVPYSPLGGWLQAQSPNIPFRHQTFSAVKCFHTFDHMTDVQGFFEETSRVMAEDAPLFFSLFNPYTVGPSESLLSAMEAEIGADWADHDEHLAATGADIFERYLQRVTLLAAEQGLELTHLSRTKDTKATKFSTLKPNETMHERWLRFAARYHDHIPPDGLDAMMPDQAATAFFFEFTKVPEGEDVVVHPVNNWIGHANGTTPYTNLATNELSHCLVSLTFDAMSHQTRRSVPAR